MQPNEKGRMETSEIVSIDATVTRLGTVLEPDGDATEAEGVLNPGAVRDRDGRLLLYPRVVAEGNVSRIGLVEASGPDGAPSFKRLGFALEPQEPYELRTVPGGYGCEDPRVTFIPVLDAFVMAYTAFGPLGPRIAVALSHDAYRWERLGLIDFSAPGLPCGDDKDAAFFPEPVLSPKGVTCIAFYHRPMLHVSALDGQAAVPIILGMPPQDRESTRIAYVPLDPMLADRRALLRVAESEIVLPPTPEWGRIKTGAGTPPVRVDEGWMSLYHGVDAEMRSNGTYSMRYSAGIVLHDRERPHIVLFRSPEPVLAPETADERRGIVNDVVFPTGIDPKGDGRDYDVYYGMADARVGRARLLLGEGALAENAEGAESAA
jgi:beta-1,2-mannobiose phosphorylase / 1,2-beta-oligomannan phosphorylase